MAKILPKGKKVTGTKKKDKIVSTGKGVWKKALAVNAGKGNDVINFKKSNYKNTLNGQDGKDTIYGGKKNDKITGGKGNDKIYTGKGTNTLIINKGDGNDTIYHQGKKTVIKVNKAKSSDTQSFSKKDNDLVMTYTHGGTKTKEVLTFKDYYKGNKNIYLGKQKLENLMNSKGMTITGSGNITGTNGNDVITGSAGSDTINVPAGNNKIDGGAGNDVINAGTGDDTINGGAGDDVIDLAKGGKNTVYGDAGDDKIINIKGNSVIDGGDGNDIMTAVSGNNSLLGGTGNDSITGGTGKDTVTAGFGNDTISFNSGNNTAIFASGDGEDVIVSGTGSDTLKFTDFANITALSADLSTIKEENDLALYHGATDKVVIKGYFASDSSVKTLMANNNETISLENLLNERTFFLSGSGEITGTKYKDNILGSVEADIITAGAGNDTITAGAGNDIINAGAGNNTIKFNIGDGVDTIVSGDGTDTLVFSDETDFSNFTFSYVENDLNISVGETTVLLKDYYLGGHSVQYIKIGDTTFQINPNEPIPLGTNPESYKIVASTNNDLLLGDKTTSEYDLTNGGNNVVCVADTYDYFTDIRLGSGNDTIFGSRSNNSWNKDLIHFRNGSEDTNEDKGHNVYYYGGGKLEIDCNTMGAFTREDDDLTFRYKNSSLTMKGYYTLDEGTQSQHFQINQYTSPTSYIPGRIINNYLNEIGGVRDNYHEYTNGKDIINNGAGSDVITPGNGDDVIHLGAGNDYLFDGSGDKTIYTDSGDNVINLGSGNNTVFAGIGSDIINYGGGNDTITFNSDTFANLNIDLRNGKKVITKTSDGNTVTINHLDSLTEGITIKDSTNTTTSSLFDLNTTIGIDTLTTAQTLTTGKGNDIIYTGLGDDTIVSGKGTAEVHNTIYLTHADTGNNDTFTYTSGAYDTFVLPETVANFSDLKIYKSGTSPKIAFGDDPSNNTLSITGYYDEEGNVLNPAFMANYVSFIRSTGGNPYGSSKTVQELITANGIIEPIIGDDSDNNLGDSLTISNQVISGMGGNDAIYGGSGSDLLNGGAGSDNISGGAGDDVYEIDSADWGDGQDTITDSAGSDTLRIDTTSDNIHLFFDVTQTGLVSNGEVFYTLGNDLYINSDKTYTYDRATTYNGVKITDYFTTENRVIESILIRKDENNWQDANISDTVDKVAQAVANWLRNKGYTSTQQVLNEGSTKDKNTLIGLYQYNPNIIERNDVSPKYYNIWGTDGDDVIIAFSRVQELYAGAGNDTLYGGNDSEHNAKYYYLTEGGNNTAYLTEARGASVVVYLGSGNDTIYGIPQKQGYDLYNFDTIIKFKYGSTDTNEHKGHNTYYYRGEGIYIDCNTMGIFTKEGNDLTFRYHDSSLTMKNYYTYDSEDKNNFGIHRYEGTGYTFSSIQHYLEEIGGVIDRTGNDTITTENGGSEWVYGGSGRNEIWSYGDDNIVVDGGSTDIINLRNEETTKNIYMDKGAKTQIYGRTYADYINIIFSNADYKNNNEIMIYFDPVANEDNSANFVSLVTRNWETRADLFAVYTREDGGDLNYIEGNINYCVKDKYCDKQIELYSLTNYYDMNHFNNEDYRRHTFYYEPESINEYSVIAGSKSWFIDGTTEDDSYTTDIPYGYMGSNTKIDIYDKGGNDDELIFENNPFVNANGNSTFFDVIITRNDDNTLASSTFGDDLYFSGAMGNLFDEDSTNDTYTCVHRYFNGNSQGVGYIENIEDAESNTIDFSKLTELKGDVASWIAANTPYSSVADVIANGTSDQKNELMELFTAAAPYTNN